ncbi:hypothetical protein Dimus_000300 [Dionaea muscipula]
MEQSKVMQKQNKELMDEYKKLVKENKMLREAIMKPLCVQCGGDALLGDLSLNEEQLRDENAKLREQLAEMWPLAETVMGKSEAEAAFSNLNHSRNTNTKTTAASASASASAGPFILGGADAHSSAMLYSDDGGIPIPSSSSNGPSTSCTNHNLDYNRSPYLAVAISAMEEVLALAQRDGALWYKIFDGGKDILNMEEYTKRFSPFSPPRDPGFITDATREAAKVPVAASDLVKAFMSCERWVDLFPGMVGQASIHEHLYRGQAGELQMMSAEFLFPSPFIPLRRDKFIRYSVQHQGTWIVVDSSVGNMAEGFYADTMKCRRMPSGIVVRDSNNGSSMVTWIEHIEYDETCAPHIYRPLLRSGLAFGAERWLATLQRQCECSSASLMSIDFDIKDESGGMTEEGTASIVKLARRMTASFGVAISASSIKCWKKLDNNMGLGGGSCKDMQVMTRSNYNDPGEPYGVVLSIATSICLPVPREKLFDFLCNGSSRGRWCILSNGGPMLELARISRCHHNNMEYCNCIALLYPPAAPETDKNMLILQQAWSDKTGSLLVYAPVDVQTMTAIMSGDGDPNSAAILPSGFAIVDALTDCNFQDNILGNGGCASSILSMGLQLLYSNQLRAEDPTIEFVNTVDSLFSHTISNIKAALNCS